MVHLGSFLTVSGFETGQDGLIDGNLKEPAMFDVVAANDPRSAIRLVRDGGIALLEVHPGPMTEAQAAAWLANLYL
jgi:hypothetical protein